MPTLIPERPAFHADRGAEKRVWKALADTLPDEAVLIHGLRITRRSRDREGDLVVLWPGVGIAVIEVKGGHMTERPDGRFLQSDGTGKSKPVDPLDQARLLMHDLVKWFNSKTSIQTNYNFTFMAAMPYASVNDEWHSTIATRKQIVDRRDLPNAAAMVREALLDNEGVRVSPDARTVEHMVKALEANVLDAHNPVELAGLLDERSEHITTLLAANESKLDFVAEVPRFAVSGPAGSGKTAMAMSLARRLTESGHRVLYLCYSTLLAADLRHREEALDKPRRIAAINTLHSIGPRLGIQIPKGAAQPFWEVELPALIKDAAKALKPDAKFDAIVVDEAQDFSPDWWPTVQSLLRDPDKGRIHTFSDSGQTVFNRGGGLGLDLIQLRLGVNLRNTQEIADGSNLLTDTPAPCIGPEGPAIQYCEVPEWADVTKAGDTIAASMLNYYRPSDIAFLQTRHRHPVHREWEAKSRDFYNRQYWEGDDVFYSTVAKFKGLERHCVVLVVDGFNDTMPERETLYVGMTRAQDLLIVVARRSELEPHVDPELMDLLDANRLDLADDEYEEREED